MNKALLIISSAIFAVITLSARAQVNVQDSSVTVNMLYAAYAYQFPGGDLRERFGNNSGIGGGYQVKLKKNWLLGVDFNYIFGNNVKGADSLFQSISTAEGFVINSNGEYTDIYFYERGFHISARFGKVFPVWSPNPNSGPFVMGGVGLLQHKIRIENPMNTAPQISGEYKKGYDKLTNGIAVSEFVGYMFMGSRRLVSFFAGIECTQAFTQSRRSHDFNLRRYDAKSRVDLLWGIRVGWIIPFYKRAPAGYYYYD
jgi:hypothetical protein